MTRAIGVFLLLLASPRMLCAEESCVTNFGEAVCLDAAQHETTLTISAHNPLEYEVTVTVNAKLKNMTSSVKLPHTRVLDGRFRQPILKFVANPAGDWEWEYSFNWAIGSFKAQHDPSVVYDLPYQGTYEVTQGFHGTFSHTEDDEYAVDWGMPAGTPLYAAREGIVIATRSTMSKGGGARDKFGGLQNFIWIRHSDGTIASYDHLKQGGVVVKVGERVSRKQLIGYSGNTGFSDRAHLHFVITRPVDGFRYQSFPMRFRTAAGIITPAEGRSYTSVDDSR
jgi:murein DD-endopeptidase MepM/ murein hydrolase activator NlpD